MQRVARRAKSVRTTRTVQRASRRTSSGRARVSASAPTPRMRTTASALVRETYRSMRNSLSVDFCSLRHELHHLHERESVHAVRGRQLSQRRRVRALLPCRHLHQRREMLRSASDERCPIVHLLLLAVAACAGGCLQCDSFTNCALCASGLWNLVRCSCACALYSHPLCPVWRMRHEVPRSDVRAPPTNTC